MAIVQRNLFAEISSLVPSSPLYSDPHSMLTPETRGQLPSAVLDKLTSSLSSSLSHMFIWLFVPVVAVCLVVFYMPNEKLRSNKPSIQKISG